MTAPHTDSASCDIGYGKPPRHTQFQKGRSGNPGGRPRKLPVERLKALALHEAYRSVIVMEDGYATPLRAIQAVLRSQLKLAAAGNVRAQHAILTMIRDIERVDAIAAESDTLHGPANGDAGEEDDAGYSDDDCGGVEDDVDNAGGIDGPAQHAGEIDPDGERRQEEWQEEDWQAERERAAPPPPAGSVAQPEQPSSQSSCPPPPPIERWRLPPSPEPPPPPVTLWRDRLAAAREKGRAGVRRARRKN
jgi:hypothetical protein